MGSPLALVFLSLLIFASAAESGVLLPTPIPESPAKATSTNSTETSKQARAMNMSDGNSIHNSSDLSDVSMDNDEAAKIIFPETKVVNKPNIFAAEKSMTANSRSSDDGVCFDSGISYKVGERVERDCEEVCICGADGKFKCEPRCQGPFFRRNRKIDDPLCSEKHVEDPCCSILVCASKQDSCYSGNVTYSVGEKFDIGCKKSCTCESGGALSCTEMKCPVLEHRDDCVPITDPQNSCCKVQLCDVSKDDDVIPINDKKDNLILDKPTELPPTTVIAVSTIPSAARVPVIYEKFDPITSVNSLQNGSIQVTLRNKNVSDNLVHLELSKDGGSSWADVQLNNDILTGLEGGKEYIIRSKETKKKFSVVIPKVTVSGTAENFNNKKGCYHKGKHRSIDEEFHMGCEQLCLCQEDGTVHCSRLDCPSTSGLDVLDPNCVKWGTDPPDFKPIYPMCCPPAMKCISNGSCDYKGHVIPNWSEVPLEISGCEQRCFCETGSIECQDVCPPLPAVPPPNLKCLPPSRPAPQHSPGDNCCKEWMCVTSDMTKNSLTNKTELDKSKHKDKPNKTDKHNQTPLFVTLPPNIHKVIDDTFGDIEKSVNNANNDYTRPYAQPNVPTSNPSAKTDNVKHYEYPGPFADPNHKQPQSVNGLGNFPFIKKHKEKAYPHDSNNADDQPPIKHKDNPKKQSSTPNATQNQNSKIPHMPTNDNEYPVNDPFLSSRPLHIPFSQNGVGPGYFNPSTVKNQPDLLNILQQSGVNPNAIHPGIFQNGIPINNRNPPSADTIHVYTDGSPINIEHLLQHIQQTDPGQGQYVPYVPQSQRPKLPPRPSNELNSSNSAYPGFGGIPNIPSGIGLGNSGEAELKVVSLEPVSPHSLRLVFSLPNIMVGLHGRVQLRYTDTNNENPATWRFEEFAPPDDLLETQQLEFQLGGLEPDTVYKIQASVILRQISHVPRSKIYSVRTLPLTEDATAPPVIRIEPNLNIGQVNPTSVQVNWRPFTQDELQYIDGIQLRYREIDGKVFSGTPLIHRAVTTFQLESLKPNTSYEVGIYFIPFLGQHTELQSVNMFNFKTTPQTDMYDFNVVIDVSDVSAWGLMLKWTGVPRPAERFVNVYRVVWRAEAARDDRSSFLLPVRDAPAQSNITGLTPGTRYRIWLELYLTNGRVRTSNVKDVMTKPGKPAPQEASTQDGKLLEGSVTHRGDYYSSLVAVAVLAAVGAMTSLVLLMMLLRKHRAASAPICSPTAASGRTNPALPPYDSPTYKLDLQQETMDL